MNESWQQRKETAFSYIDGLFDELHSLWQTIGLPRGEQVQRTNKVTKHLQTMLKDMISEERRISHNLRDKCREHERELMHAYEDLEEEFTMPPLELTLLQKEKELRKRLTESEEKRTERQTAFDQLQREEKQLCDEVDGIPLQSPSGGLLPSLKNLRDVRAHIIQLKEVKIENLQRLICEAREELKLWFEKTHTSAHHQKLFTPFITDDLSDQVLDDVKNEISRLKKYYEDNAEILEKIGRWSTLWGKYKESELKAGDPNRLFNRGGTLLKEERDKKRILKELPKVQQEVLSEVEEWEQVHEQEYFISGMKFDKYIDQQWEDFEESKELAKGSKMKTKVQEIKKEMIYGSKPAVLGKRRMAGASYQSPNKSRKADVSKISVTTLPYDGPQNKDKVKQHV